MKKIPIFLLTPNNFFHKAGDGTKTRRREIKVIHPALTASSTGTNTVYLLECWQKEKEDKDINDKIIYEGILDKRLKTFWGETI